MAEAKALPPSGYTQKDLYDRDFVAWAESLPLLLTQKRWHELDLVNLIEQVQDLGNRHLDALESKFTRLLIHLLTLQYQSEKRSGSWTGTIREASCADCSVNLIRKHPVLAVHTEKLFWSAILTLGQIRLRRLG